MFRMSSPFVERRRLSLERFLQRTADHPELRQSDALRIFLEARGSVGETDESATQSHLRSWRERVPNSVASVRLTPLLMVALSNSSNAFAFLWWMYQSMQLMHDMHQSTARFLSRSAPIDSPEWDKTRKYFSNLEV
jgi:nitrate reductase NapE component